MGKLVSFNRADEAWEIIKNGITADSGSPRHEMNEAAWYYITQTPSYSHQQVFDLMAKCTSDYFAGMPMDGIIKPAIEDVIKTVRERATPDEIPGDMRIPIYQEELDKISALNKPDIERLAFVFLIHAKREIEKWRLKNPDKICNLRWFYDCTSELYKLAWYYDYNNTKRLVKGNKKGCSRVSGKERMNYLQALSDNEIVQFKAYPNSFRQVNHGAKSADFKFSVPILQESGEVAMELYNLTPESLVLWYDLYCDYSNIIQCDECKSPAFKASNSQKYCSVCREIAKRKDKK